MSRRQEDRRLVSEPENSAKAGAGFLFTALCSAPSAKSKGKLVANVVEVIAFAEIRSSRVGRDY